MYVYSHTAKLQLFLEAITVDNTVPFIVNNRSLAHKPVFLSACLSAYLFINSNKAWRPLSLSVCFRSGGTNTVITVLIVASRPLDPQTPEPLDLYIPPYPLIHPPSQAHIHPPICQSVSLSVCQSVSTTTVLVVLIVAPRLPDP
jgi:hypothetical protein